MRITSPLETLVRAVLVAQRRKKINSVILRSGWEISKWEIPVKNNTFKKFVYTKETVLEWKSARGIGFKKEIFF